MKHFINLRKSKLLLFSLLALLIGASPAWADGKALPYEYGFEDYNLATDGWTTQNPSGKNSGEFQIYGQAKKTGDYGFRFSSYSTNGENTQYLISPEFNAPNGVNVSFYYKASSGSGTEKFKVGYSTTDTDVANFTFGDEISTNSTSWIEYKNSFPAGTKYVAIYYYANFQYRLYVDDFSFTAPANGPALAVADGSTTINSGYNYNFGLATAGTVHYFTLSNPGTEAITLNIEATNGFSTDNSNLTLDAKASALLHVYMADATATGTVTITPTATDIDPFVINVSGTIRDANKVYIDFADGQMPNGWTATGYTSTYSSYNWEVSTGYVSYSASSSTYAGTLTSPLLTFTEGEQIFFETAKYGSSTYYNPSIVVEYSTDGSTWTAIGSAFTDDIYGTWTTRSVTIPSAGSKYIRFRGWYIHLRNIYGGELPEGASFAINTDGSTQSIGVSSINGMTAEKTFTVTNNGTSDLVVNFTDATDFYVAKNIMFTKPNSWTGDKLYMYAWDGSGSLTGEWPGIEVSEAAQNDMSEWIYTARLPKGAIGIKFSDNANNQTGDISTEGFNQMVGLWYDGVIHTWKNEAFTVAASSSAQFTVKLASTTTGEKSGNIELAFTALNATSFTIPVSGVVLSEGANFDDFTNGLPDGWTNASWTIADGEATGKSASAYLTTSKLSFSEGDNFAIRIKNYDSSTSNYITIQGSSDNGSTWTGYENKIMSTQFSSTTEWSTLIINDVPTTVNKLRFVGYYVIVDEIDGLTYDANDPHMGIYTDAECTVAAATTVTNELGFISKAPAAITYYIKNDGTGTLELSLSAELEGFTAALGSTSVAAGEKTTLTLTPVAEYKGYFGGNAVVTATGLGTFIVNVSGVLPADGKLNLNFANDNVPSTWTTNDWAKNDGGYMRAGYSSTTMETSTLVAAAGEQLVIVAKNEYTGSYTFGVNYKKEGDEEWSTLIAAANLGTSWKTLSATITEAGNYQLQFVGSYANIQRIYGLSKPNAPEMVVYDGTSVAGDSHNFGKVTDENDATWTLTVKNEGLAKLTGLNAVLSGDNADHYTVAITGATGENNDEIEAGESATVTVTQLKVNLGTHSATLTISATDLADVEIALSGTTVDHTVLNVDFDSSNDWPAEILQPVGANWQVYYGYARHTSSSAASSLVLTPLTVANAEDKLTFNVGRYSSSRDLTVRYTVDGGITWNDFNFGTAEEPVTSLKENITSTSSYNNITVTGIPAGTVAFDFYGKCIKLDDITGDYKVTSAPLMAFTTVSDGISNQNLKADGTATYTLANNGNAAYVGTVALDGVTAAVEGEDVTYTENTLTIPAGKTATITVTMAYAAPYGEKNGLLAITSESWVGDINKAYTATLVDPTQFVEDFAAGKPAGWYSETAGTTWSGWHFANGAVSISTGNPKPMITEMFGAEDGKNVFSFDAKAYSGESQTLTVYTSMDRKNWTLAKECALASNFETFSLDALADGNYYVKFEASNATIDNVTGVKKLEAPAHDLYEVSTTMAATGTPGASYTATVVGVSLRADETVTAELWLEKAGNGTKVAELTNESMTVNTNKTFTLTGNLPTEEGEYEAWVTVKNSDNSAYFNTDRIAFTLEHTTSMAVNDLEPVNSAVQADVDNMFTADFNVTLKNTGSKTLAANEVSVSITDNYGSEANVYVTKTANQYVYLYPGEYTNDNAIIAVWNWSDETDGEWVATKSMGSGLYIAELKDGKTYFNVVRVNPNGEGADNWANKWNQSVNLSTTAGNVFSFNNWDDKTDDNHNFSASAFTLAANETVVLPVSVTAWAGDGGTFSFNAKENVTNTFYHNSYNRSVNVTAYVIVLDEEVGTIASTGSGRKVRLNRSFQKGWNSICLPFAVDDVEGVFGAGAVAYKLDGFDTENKIMTFTSVESIEAAKPYLIKMPAAKTEAIEVSGVTVVAEAGSETIAGVTGVTFQGTYTPMAAGSLTDKYVVTKGEDTKIARCNANATLKGFRCYFEGININLAEARISIFDVPTGITTIYGADKLFQVEGTYNMNGQKVETARKGVYIVNGKKVVIK